MKQLKRVVIIFLLVISINLSGQNSTPANMVLIPKGEFNMGKNSTGPSDWQPEHMLSIDAFYLDQYEVTNRQYAEFCKATKHAFPLFWGMKAFQCGFEFPDHPVIGVSWFEAEQYARWAGKRLPTEAEWEYAARGGLANQNFPNGDKIDSTLANFGGKFMGSLKIGSFQPNGYGLYDMAGNVWEWTADNYKDDYYRISPSANPKGPETGRFKVIRGGSWHSGAMCNQNFFRNGLSPSWLDFAVGFRCARNVA